MNSVGDGVGAVSCEHSCALGMGLVFVETDKHQDFPAVAVPSWEAMEWASAQEMPAQ